MYMKALEKKLFKNVGEIIYGVVLKLHHTILDELWPPSPHRHAFYY